MTESLKLIMRRLLEDAEFLAALKEVCTTEQRAWERLLITEMQKINPQEPPNILASASYAASARAWGDVVTILYRYAQIQPPKENG